MFKEEKFLILTALILLAVQSLSLFYGQAEFINFVFNAFAIENKLFIKFAYDIMVVEKSILSNFTNELTGFIGLSFTVVAAACLFYIRKPSRKRIMMSGVIYIAIGFLEMILLDISVIGWMAGPMMIIGGFLLFRKSKLIL